MDTQTITTTEEQLKQKIDLSVIVQRTSDQFLND